MGKTRDAKVAILPSTTRKGTTLSTSAALDSPYVISQLVSPPQASRVGTSAESENSSDNFDDASTVLDENGSLGPFLDATIARSRQIEITEIPNENTVTLLTPSDDPDEDYVELDDDFIDKCNATTGTSNLKKLLAQHAVRYKLSPDPKFATSPINIKDKDYDFSLDLSHISIVEKTPFCGTEKESVVEHMNELSTLSSLFSDDIKMRTYFVAKNFPFSLKDDAKTWYNSLPPDSIDSPSCLLDVFFRKYFPASAQHIALQKIYSFDQEDGEKLPEAWARFCSLIRARPGHELEKHDLLDIFYSGLTIESRAYLDSCAGCVFRKRTPDEAEELLARISQNHDDWTTPEPTPTPILKKRGMIELNDEDMREAKKSLMEKGIKSEDVKNLPPIEDLCKITPPSSTIEVHSLQRFDKGDIPYSKPPDQCLDEFDNYVVKQDNFNMRVENHLMENSQAIRKLHDIVERTSNDVKMLVKHFHMVQTQIDQLTKVQNDLLKNTHKEKHAYEVTTRGGVSTQDPLYPEGHPKRVEQDSQQTKETSGPSKKKKKKHKTVVESSEPVNDPNSISISDAETESGNEHDKDNDKNDVSDKEEIENEPEKHAKNKKYTKEDFIAKKHGAVIDCNKGKVTFNVDDKEHTVYFPKRIDKVYGVNTISNVRTIKVGTIDCPIYEPKEGYQTIVIGSISIQYKKRKMNNHTFGEVFERDMPRMTRPSRESTRIRRSYDEDVIAPSFEAEEDNEVPNASSFPCFDFLRNAGTSKKIENRPKALTELYREVTNDDDRTIQRGKIRNIQLPAIRYFAYYLATSILGRENTSNISSYHLAFLVAALTGSTPYHLGALIARRLSSKGPIYGGIIASRIVAHLGLSIDPNDEILTPVRLDIAAMKSHQFVTTDSNLENIVYRMLFIDGDEREIPLPQADLFSVRRRPWSRSKEEVDDQLRILGFHQQHDSEDAEPSDGYTITYPGASSSGYQGQDPPSSYYGGATSWAPWD
ncbi:hypothetical protein QYE76_033172 [Lolium multiflorum]|uniref:Retrotransposon gag domain-containing protein n=1 Tax=Lolium multiflorum TaxID=4521 RepID=A0AAD8VK28_LOLMU|nr:hypothetical protein QYE76_033172 [Lolium multiflorum]